MSFTNENGSGIWELSLSQRVVLGICLSLAVSAAIMSQSIDSAWPWLALGATWMTAAVAARGIYTQRGANRRLFGGILATCAIVLLASLLILAERVYYTGNMHYARWLTNGELAAGTTWQDLMAGPCKGRSPLEVNEQADGQFLIRCGLLWSNSKLFLSTTFPEEGRK